MPIDRFRREIPDGDDRERLVCGDCGFVNYENPKIVVGSVCTWQEKILLCKRAINPRRGYWTLPAGFLELHESPSAGAIREAHEEANAVIEIDSLLAVYTIAHISQVQLFYRARLVTPEIAAGPESEAVGLYTWDEIPWEELAFPTVHWALAHFRELAGETDYQPRTNPPGQDAFRLGS